MDDASETSPVKPQKAPHEPDSPATVIPNANGFRHTNGVDSDGFRRPHDRRPNALPNGRLPHAEGHASQDGFGVPGRGRSQGRTEPIPRGRSSDVKHDSFTGRPANTLQQGDHADRYGPRRYGSKDADRPREVARPRREVPQKDGTKPLSVFRNPDTSRNTVMASKGADGRIAITAEAANATKPASANHVTPQQDAPVPKPQPSVKAAAETPLPRPAPVAVATAPTASATHPITPSASSAGPNRPTSAASDSASVPSISREHFPALPEIAPPTPKATAAPAAVSATASDSSVPAASSQMGNPPPGLSNPEPSPAPPPGLTNQQPAPGPVLPPGPALHQPQSQPQHQQPSVVPHGPQPARSAQHSGVSQPQMPSPAQAPAVATTSNQTASLAPQHQAQPAAQIPNGFPHSQLHQQMLHRLHQAGVNNRLHLQNQPADSHPPFAQPRPIMAAAPQQNGNMPMTNGPPHVSPPTEQRASPPADTDMGTSDEHAAPQQAPARPLHQGSSPQSSRSGSVGHKRPMPAQEYQQPHPSQQLMPSNQQMLGPQHQARGGSAGPPVMGSPFNGAQLTSGMLPQYMHPNHNGMPSNGPMPTMRLPNGMQNGMVPAMFSPNMIPPNQRPSLNMNHMMAMLPKPQQQQQQQQQGSMPYPAPSQYVMQQQMGSGPMPQLVSGAMHRPNTSHSFPINNPQAQPFHPRDMPQQPNFNQPRPSQPAATPSARPGPHAMPTLSTSKSLTSRALRADAPSFVPGGFAPQSPAPQAPQTPSAALLHQAMQGRAAQADQQPSLAGPAAGMCAKPSSNRILAGMHYLLAFANQVHAIKPCISTHATGCSLPVQLQCSCCTVMLADDMSFVEVQLHGTSANTVWVCLLLCESLNP